MTNKQLIKAMIYMFIKTSVLTLAALFIADDLGLLRHD
jgi:hypothetical protein